LEKLFPLRKLFFIIVLYLYEDKARLQLHQSITLKAEKGKSRQLKIKNSAGLKPHKNL
jgi:hypothetical protein